MARKKNALLVIILIPIIILLAIITWFLVIKNTTISVVNPYEITISKGETIHSVIDKLKTDGIIEQDFWLKLYIKMFQEKANIQAGHFIIDKNITYGNLFQIFEHGTDKSLTITFLEGWSNNEILTELSNKGFKYPSLLNCLLNCEFDFDFITEEIKKYNYEGYLYPDTYEFSENETPFSIFNRMLGNFENKISSQNFENKSIEEVLIKAALIEREVQNDTDKKLVAGIIENRLNQNMTLGIDASILYALGKWDASLTKESLEIDSPYNTRKYQGLPPSPICNPSLSSIEAVLNPTDTDFYYYLNDTDTGETHFSKTLEAHNENKAKYIK